RLDSPNRTYSYAAGAHTRALRDGPLARRSALALLRCSLLASRRARRSPAHRTRAVRRCPREHWGFDSVPYAPPLRSMECPELKSPRTWTDGYCKIPAQCRLRETGLICWFQVRTTRHRISGHRNLKTHCGRWDPHLENPPRSRPEQPVHADGIFYPSAKVARARERPVRLYPVESDSARRRYPPSSREPSPAARY